MLVLQDMMGMRASTAFCRGIAKKKGESPLKKSFRRTPTKQFVTELCKQSHNVSAAVSARRRSIKGVGSGTISNSGVGVMCGDGFFDHETDVRQDAFEYMKEKEQETRANAANIGQQPEIMWEMRPILIDFIVQVHNHYKLRQETLYLAVNILDRYMSKAIVLKRHYQLVGMTCLWLASKYEDGQDSVLRTSLLCYLCCNVYDEKAFVTMERHILSTLDWDLGHPTAEAFLKKLLNDYNYDDRRTQHVARFLMELTLFHAHFISYGSYTVAASCLYFARYILGTPQKALLEQDPRFRCVQLLDCSLANVSCVVHTKYTNAKFGRASTVVKNWVDDGNRFFRPDEESMDGDEDSTCSTDTISNMVWQSSSPASSLSDCNSYVEKKENQCSDNNKNHSTLYKQFRQQFSHPQSLPPLQPSRATSGFRHILTQTRGCTDGL